MLWSDGFNNSCHRLWRIKLKVCAFPNIVFSDRETRIAQSPASPGAQHSSGNDCPIFPPHSAAQHCGARQVHIPAPHSTFNEQPADCANVCVCTTTSTFYISPPPSTPQQTYCCLSTPTLSSWVLKRSSCSGISMTHTNSFRTRRKLREHRCFMQTWKHTHYTCLDIFPKLLQSCQNLVMPCWSLIISTVHLCTSKL